MFEGLLADFLLPIQGKITGQFGEQRSTHKHAGIDIAGGMGEPIRATKSGVVSFAGPQQGYGNTLIVDNGNGMQELYGHASALGAKVGQRIDAGDVIANVGSTGNSTGPHLHYETRLNGVAVNPFNSGPLKATKEDTAFETHPVYDSLAEDRKIRMRGLLASLLPPPPTAIAPVMQPLLDKVFNFGQPSINPLKAPTAAQPITPLMTAPAAPLGGLFDRLLGGGSPLRPPQTPIMPMTPEHGDIPNLIMAEAKAQGVNPALALAIARTESGFNPNAKNPSGATGVYQLMPATAKEMGVDEKDTKQNIKGGIKYLKYLNNYYHGDQDKVIQAYNAGMGNVDRGRAASFPETQNYLKKVKRGLA